MSNDRSLDHAELKQGLDSNQKKSTSSRSIDVHIVNIRRKIESTGLKIVNFRGKGFQLDSMMEKPC